MDITFLNQYAQIWLLVLLVILVYAAIQKFDLKGTKWTHFLIALMIGFLFTLSGRASLYVFNTIPGLTVILVITIFSLIMLSFAAVKLDDFKKPISWIAFGAGLIILLVAAINIFPSVIHLLPNTSDSGLTHAEREIKHWIGTDSVKESIIFIVALSITAVALLKK